VKPIHNIIPFLIIAAVSLIAWLLLPGTGAFKKNCPAAEANMQGKDSNTQNAGGDNFFNEGFFRINTTLR